jgi:hypothetical protein
MHITDPPRRRLIQERLRAPGRRRSATRSRPANPRDLASRCATAPSGANVFSRRRRALIPLVDEILDASGQRGAVIGDGHEPPRPAERNRAHWRAPKSLPGSDVDRACSGSGDVKYHGRNRYITRSEVQITWFQSQRTGGGPVTVGTHRAKQDRAGEVARRNTCRCSFSDAAFAGPRSIV